MQNKQILKLYKVGDNVVFYSKDLQKQRNETYASIINDEKICIDVYGNEMEKIAAANDFLLMTDFFIPKNEEEQVLRNINIGIKFIAIIRVDMIKAGVGLEYMNTFSTALTSINIGALDTARILINDFTEDEYITAARKTRWSDMLASSDAIQF